VAKFKPTARKAEPGGDHLWTVSVDSKNRIDLPAPVVDEVLWLHRQRNLATSISAVMVPLEDLPAVELILPEMDKLASAMNGRESPMSLTESETRQLYRLLADRCGVVIEVRSRGSYRMALPREMRKIGLLPGYPGEVRIYARKNSIEIWDLDHWRANRARCLSLWSDKQSELEE
jgi:DNA-binding transcriptional regulator/RsmH inhibitor MraZ